MSMTAAELLELYPLPWHWHRSGRCFMIRADNDRSILEYHCLVTVKLIVACVNAVGRFKNPEEVEKVIMRAQTTSKIKRTWTGDKLGLALRRLKYALAALDQEPDEETDRD